MNHILFTDTIMDKSGWRDGPMGILYGRQREIKPYDREKALKYAHKWAYARNPAYLDFENLGGDCTNFASQCIYAGSGIMNYAPIYGWYYSNSYNRTASWTGVNYLYEFLVNNTGAGPFAELVDISDAEPGDIAQISFSDSRVFDHSPVIVKKENQSGKSGIFIAAHTFDTDFYRLVDFEPLYTRYLHIAGVRV
jgi:hypothetical protein